MADAESVFIIFRSRLRPESLAEYEVWADRIDALARRQPGFIAIKRFDAEDGERVSIVEFASAAEALTWRNHPEHREAQRLGRERFYSEYDVTVCAQLRRYSFEMKGEKG
jgi:heme-degrading monooxygenase HmoA